MARGAMWHRYIVSLRRVVGVGRHAAAGRYDNTHEVVAAFAAAVSDAVEIQLDHQWWPGRRGAGSQGGGGYHQAGERRLELGHTNGTLGNVGPLHGRDLEHLTGRYEKDL